MATRRFLNFNDVVEEVFYDLDDSNLVDSEEEQLDEDFIYVNRRIIAFEPDFEEAEDVSSTAGDAHNAAAELQDREDRTGDVEDLDEEETGYQDSEDKTEDDNSEDLSDIEECDSQHDSDEDDSGEENGLQPDYDPSRAWRKKPAGMGFIPSFRKTKTGPTHPPNRELTPLDYFFYFFTDFIWDLLVTETNRYAAQVLGSRMHPHQRPWKDVDRAEMKAFIGIILAFGIIRLPRIELYWQKKYPLFSIPSFSNVMSLVRFQQIWRFLYLADSEKQVPIGQPGHDKLYKVRVFLDNLQENFSAEYSLPCQVTIDECMIPFKGRLGFKQYIKNKPHKWGIKGFVLASATTGYISRILIYCGKGTIEGIDISKEQAKKVVLYLMDGLEKTGHELYTDNFYTSSALCAELFKRGITTCGTVRKDRKDFPKEIIFRKATTKITRGEHLYCFNGPVTAVAWFDRRPVYFLTTIHSAPKPGTYSVSRRGDRGRAVSVPAPPCAIEYIKYMRGVDRGDQMISLYNCGRRSKKWWKRLFFHLLECSVLNAYILHQDHGIHPTLSHLQFREELVTQLISNFSSRKRQAAHRAETERLQPELKHLPIHVDSIKDCVCCNITGAKKKLEKADYRHRSAFKCSYCDVHLCIAKDRNCFFKYHSSERFWNAQDL